MSIRARRNHALAFKAKVALAAIKDGRLRIADHFEDLVLPGTAETT